MIRLSTFRVALFMMTDCESLNLFSRNRIPSYFSRMKARDITQNSISTKRRDNEIESSVADNLSCLNSFVSQPMHLFIEDTDAYGVKFNSNYIRSYERALYRAHHDYARREEEENENNDDNIIGILRNNSDFCVSQVTAHKFKASPALGTQFIVNGKLISTTESSKMDEQVESWSLEMIEHQDLHPVEIPRVYNTAVVTISKPFKKGSKHSIIQPFKVENGDNCVSKITLHSVYRDELSDCHMPGALPIRSCLNLFERSRSLSIDPENLRKMLEEDNLLWAVISIDDLKIDTRDLLQPGQDLTVRSYFTIKRKGMIVECQQEIIASIPTYGKDVDCNDKKINKLVVAQGVVTLCAIDNVKRRPTSNIPDHVLALFQ